MKNGIFRLTACLILLCLCLPQFGCAEKKEQYTKSYFEYFDTVSTVVGYESEQETFDANCAYIRSRLEYYNRLFDIYHAYEGVNNLYTVNKYAGQSPVKVDAQLLDFIDFAKQVYSLTSGKTNIAMGSVLSIWHIYREDGNYDPKNAELPPMEKLSAAAEHCDIDKVITDRENGTLYLADADMSIDVGAVGKGYATELIANELIAKGIVNYSLNVGGNIRTIGTKANGDGWVAGVQNPDTASEETFIAYVSLADVSFVTSGSYQRYYYVGDKKYHHIIDPETLMPKDNFTSVSIVAADSGIADALSTACFTMTLEEGKTLVASLEGVEAMWVDRDGETHYSDGFENYLSK